MPQHPHLTPNLVMPPRRKAGATQAARNADDDDENFGDEMDLDDAAEEQPRRKQKGAGATGRRTGASGGASLSADVCEIASNSRFSTERLPSRTLRRKLETSVGWLFLPNIAERY